MKKCILMAGLMVLVIPLLLAQTKPKAKQKEAMPTQTEMEDMMKEMQAEIDNLDPEAKRAMDSMGIQIPSLNAMPKVTEADLQNAVDAENRIVPEKDLARITKISKVPLTRATVPAFVLAVHGKVVLRLKPASKTKGEEIYALIKSKHNSPVATGNTAAALWMMGKVELAVYVMSKACIDDPSKTDNLNNYASMLSMSGAEQMAIPILEFLNKRFPNNSTILNNIGQAWFGLGEIEKANTYLDSTLRIYAYHPQANYTKSFIEESKGNKAKAIEAAKRSIKKAYSQQKENRLKKLGYKLKGDDLNWERPMPQDPLGLEKFKWPDYPKNVTESETLEKEWQVFKTICANEMATLKAQQQKLEGAMIAEDQKRIQQLFKAGQNGSMIDPMPRLSHKADLKLRYLIDGKDGRLAVSYQQKQEALAAALAQIEDIKREFSTQTEALNKKYKDQFGEGKPNPFEAACRDQNNVINNYLRSSNTLLHAASTDYLNFLRRKLNDEMYYYQYTMWPANFEVAKVHAKIIWLGSIMGQKVMFENKGAWCQPGPEKKPEPSKLTEFDDVHCEYHSELKLLVGKMTIDCSRMTTELDLSFLKLGLKQDMNKETFGDQFVSCSVEVGASESAGFDLGPLKAEASIGAAIGMEFDRTGVSDVILKTSAGVSLEADIIEGGSAAGVGVKDPALEIGVKGQISIISGKSSIESTGLLAGL